MFVRPPKQLEDQPRRLVNIRPIPAFHHIAAVQPPS
jgi:hypothetical protein